MLKRPDWRFGALALLGFPARIARGRAPNKPDLRVLGAASPVTSATGEVIFYLALGAQIGLADLAAGSSAAVSERLLAALDQPALVGQLCQFGEVIREHGGFATPVTR